MAFSQLPSIQRAALMQFKSSHFLEAYPEEGMKFAAQNGFIEAFMLFKAAMPKPMGVKSLDESMALAAKNGHKEMVDLCEASGATNYDWALCSAAEGGHEDIVSLCFDWGATDYNGALISAASSGNEKMIDFLAGLIKSYEKESCQRCKRPEYCSCCKQTEIFSVVADGVYAAALYGHLNIIEACEEWFEKFFRCSCIFNNAMAYAAQGGHEAIVKFCAKNGAEKKGVCDQEEGTEYENAMNSAAFGGHMNIVTLCLKNGAKNFDKAIEEAKKRGHTDIVKVLKAWRKR